MLKIQDGCNNFCTYCVIPYTRGRIRSLPLEEMARQAAHLAADGYRELVLTGIEIASLRPGSSGRAYAADAVETVAAAAPQMRLRLGSIEPTVITEDFCRRAAATGQVCRHFHLSLQSGCDRTLARMNRKYTTAEFLACVERLRRYFPGCALTADMITGFPGETEDDQAQAVAFRSRSLCGRARVPVFPPSRHEADAMPEQLSHAVKSARAMRRCAWPMPASSAIWCSRSARRCPFCSRRSMTAAGSDTRTTIVWCALRGTICADL